MHCQIELLAKSQRLPQPGHGREVGEPILEKELRQDAPVIGVVPDDLNRQDLGIAEQGVLVDVKRQRAVVKGMKHLVKHLGPCAERLACTVDGDQLGDVGVGNGNEVAARRIKRVQKQTRFPGERPALVGEYLLAAIRETFEEREVLKQGAFAVQLVKKTGLVGLEPVHGFFKGIHGVQWVLPGVCHDAHRVRTGCQRDQPNPVARADQVVGGEPAGLGIAARTPVGVVAPLVNADAVLDAKPHRMRCVGVVLRQAQLALEQAGATTGIDHPACPQGLFAMRCFTNHHVFVSAARGCQIDLANHRSVHELHPTSLRFLGQEVFKNAAVDLVAGHGQVAAGPDFSDLVDVPPPLGKKETKAKFAQLLGFQVLVQTQHLVKIVRANLNRRFPHLVGRDGDGVAAPFQHGDVQADKTLFELQRQCQTRQTAPHDDHVMRSRGRCWSGHGKVGALKGPKVR